MKKYLNNRNDTQSEHLLPLYQNHMIIVKTIKKKLSTRQDKFMLPDVFELGLWMTPWNTFPMLCHLE